MKIAFYNHFHNGDIFTSREYVKQVMNEMPFEDVVYLHNNNPKLLQDVVRHDTLSSQYPANLRFFVHEETLFINTWIGVYSEAQFKEPPHFYDVGIDYVSLTNMWGHIFAAINNVFGKKLKIGHRDQYMPTIDYTKFDCSKVDQFTKEHGNIVLISNGPPMSGQSFDSVLTDDINMIANQFKDLTFVYTHPITSCHPNMFYSGDITQEKSDLIELSYLSRSAKVIVGKNSGPYIYATVKENMLDKNKTFLQFNKEERDSLFYAMPYKCSYTYVSPRYWRKAEHFMISHIKRAFYNE